MFQGSGVSSTLHNIQESLEKAFKEKYGIEDSEKIQAVLKAHGLHKTNFDFIENAEKFLTSEPLNDLSIDANANKNEKTVSGILTEVTLPINKVVGYRFLYRVMKDLYGADEAKRLSSLMYDFTLAMGDSTKILNVYCWAFDASKLVLEGRPYGQLKSGPPKRLHSYIGMLNETVHQFPLHLAGALAVTTFFLDIAHILLYREKMSIEKIMTDEETRKYIMNAYQAFVHSVNHLSRSNSESPFSNISIFDRAKLKSLLAMDGGMGWYFQEHMENGQAEEIIELIVSLQELFFEFFDKGDQAQNGLPYRFPVVTVNLSKNMDKSGEWIVSDSKFTKEFCKRDIYRYNILVSEGSKTASCCRLLSDAEKMGLAAQTNSFGGSAMSMGSHRVVTINFNRLALEATSYEEYLELIKLRVDDTLKILKAHKELLNRTEDSGLQAMFKTGWIKKNNLFSTIGILGVYEANINLKKKFGNRGVDYTYETLDLLNKESVSKAPSFGLILNQEQIPGESLAPKLAKVDRMIFGEDAVPQTMYSNQFVPLWEEATIWERMEIDGKYNQLLTGGGIVHFNLKSKVTPTQAEKLIKYACKTGSEHFALNSVYCLCENDHYSMGSYDICPKCSAPIKDRLTRVVGFFVPVSSWGEIRREWEFPKRIFKGVE